MEHLSTSASTFNEVLLVCEKSNGGVCVWFFSKCEPQSPQSHSHEDLLKMGVPGLHPSCSELWESLGVNLHVQQASQVNLSLHTVWY